MRYPMNYSEIIESERVRESLFHTAQMQGILIEARPRKCRIPIVRRKVATGLWLDVNFAIQLLWPSSFKVIDGGAALYRDVAHHGNHYYYYYYYISLHL